MRSDELQRIVRAAEPPVRQLLILGLMTGARLRELGNATWERNVDLKERMLTLHADETKTRAERQVPLNGLAVETLMSLPGRGHGGRVFPVTAAHLGKLFTRTARAAGVNGKSFHCIRHTVISRLHEAGIPIGTVSLLVGHASRGTTLRTYTHVTTDELRRAVEVLETWFTDAQRSAQIPAHGAVSI